VFFDKLNGVAKNVVPDLNQGDLEVDNYDIEYDQSLSRNQRNCWPIEAV
jgi:hypothetical protein